MAKLPYDVVALEANKLLDNLYRAKDLDEASAMYDTYVQYLEACGWDDKSFDIESLKRIDKAWDEPTKPIPEVIKKHKKRYLN